MVGVMSVVRSRASAGSSAGDMAGGNFECRAGANCGSWLVRRPGPSLGSVVGVRFLGSGLGVCPGSWAAGMSVVWAVAIDGVRSWGRAGDSAGGQPQ